MANFRKCLALYQGHLWLYPKAYRDQFGDQIMQAAHDMLEGAADSHERQRLWVRLIGELPANIGRQHLIYLGEYMHINPRLLITGLWLAIATLAWLAFPYLRAIGTTWMNTAGALRVMGLLFFVIAFIAAPVALAALALFNRPKTMYRRLAAVIGAVR